MLIVQAIVCGAISFTAGMIFMSALCIKRNTEIANSKENAEYRAMLHFRKLQKIENTLNKDEQNKTPSVLTIKKIKEILADNDND